MGPVTAKGALWHQAGTTHMGIEASFGPNSNWL